MSQIDGFEAFETRSATVSYIHAENRQASLHGSKSAADCLVG